MKIIKHEVSSYVDGHLFRKDLYNTKKRALERVRCGDSYSREYSGVVEIDVYCESCNKDLSIGDEYIKVDDHTRYCSDCYEENRFTYYVVGGEHVGDENDTELYDEFDSEVME